MSLLRAACGVLGQQGAGGGGNSYSAEVLADSPVGYWKLDDASGSFADSSGNGNTATASGTITYSQSGLITGSTSSVTMATAAHGEFGTIVSSEADVTLELWVKPDGTALTSKTLIEAGGNGVGIALETDGSDQVVAYHADSGTTATSTTVLSSGTVYHIALTSDAGVGMRLYINGSEEDSSLSGTWGNATGTSGGRFCARDASSAGTVALGNGVTGDYDEVAVYNTALSAARIQAHYDARNTA